VYDAFDFLAWSDLDSAASERLLDDCRADSAA
jgi:hypothetical protein